MIAGVAHATIHAQRLDACRTPKPPMIAAAIDTIPDGVFSRADRFGEKPISFNKVAEYVLITPLVAESFGEH